MEKIYEIVGDFQANDIVINEEFKKIFQHYQDLKPKKKYSKELMNYLKKHYPQITDVTIDFLERLLHLDPLKRMSCE